MSLDRIACRIPSIPQVSMTRLKFGAFILLTNVILCMCPATAWAQKQAVKPSYPTPQHPQKYVPGRLLVRFRSGKSEEVKVHAHLALGTRAKLSFKQVPDLQLVELPTDLDVLAAAQMYRQNPDVLYAEPDYRVFPSDVTPNDPLLPLTWGMKNIGDQNGVAGADIHATSAWQLSTGSRNVVIGLLDTGVDYRHPELAANIYQNMPECNNNGLDNDGNGWVNDCHGINVTSDGNPANEPIDYIGHGTHVSGTMGALGNNGIGVAGINWQVSIIPCKFIDFDGGTTSGAVQCLDYMAWFKKHGVNVVATNNSWGGGFYSRALHDAIEAQMQLGILFVAAAGNGDAYGNSSDNDVNSVYPASYDLPNVIAVAATDRRDDLAWFSNYGRHSVHLGAPGVSVISTFRNGSYQELSGTSMATPHVTGSAALLEAYNPSLNWIGIKNLLLSSGDPDPNLSGTVTQKRLNVYGAMTCSNQSILAREQPRGNLVTTTAYSPVLVRTLNINCAQPAGNVAVTVQPGGALIQLLDDGNTPDVAANDGIYSATWTPTQAGQYTLAFPNGDAVTVDVLKPYNFGGAPSNYVSIGGIDLALEDENTAVVTLPFPIHFGGQSFTTIYVSDNGVITFDRAFNIALGLPIPWFDGGAIVAPFWDDLQPIFPPDTNNVYWDVSGTAPSRQVVIEWRNVFHYPFGHLGGGTVTFQVVFHEDRDDVEFNYANVDFGYYGQYSSGGATASVGIQVGPAQGTQYSLYTKSLTAGMSLEWKLASPDFALNLDSSSATAFPNQSATFTGKVQALFGLANSSVTLSCAGAAPPTCSGTTVSPTSKGTSFAIQAASGTPGTYNFQIQGQSSDTPPLIHQLSGTLNIVDFVLGMPSPATISIPDGGSASASFTLSALGPFNAPITLSCGGLPSGATCSFSPANQITATGSAAIPVSLTITLGSKTPLGTRTISILANTAGAPAAKWQPLSIQVQSNPDFLLTTTGSSLISFTGSSASGSFTIDTQDSYTGTVQLGCTVSPVGPTCTLSSTSASAFPATVSLTVNPGSAAPGVYQMSITGSDSSKSHTLNFAYHLVGFSVTAPPSTFIAYPAGYNQFSFTINPQAGYTGTVNVSCDARALPAGVQCGTSPSSFNFSQSTYGNELVSLFVPLGTPGGTFPLTITIQDSNGPPAKQLTVNVTIEGFTFTLGQTKEQTVLVGNTSAPFDLIFTPYNGYNLPTTIVPWTCNPAGAICNLTPSNTITPNGAPVDIKMIVNVPVQDALSLGGDFSFTVLAQANIPGVTGYNISVPIDNQVTIHVQDFALVPSDSQFTLVPGSSTAFFITNRQFNGLNVPVNLTCPSPLPPGVSCTIDKTTLAAGDVATVTFSATSNAPPSLRTFNFVGVANVNGQTIQHTASLMAWISNFSVSIDPASISVPAGGDAWFLVGVNESALLPGQAPGTFTCSSPDPGITCDSPYELPSGAGPFHFYVNVRTTGGVTPVGSHPFTVSLTEWGQTVSATGTIVMQGTDGIVVLTPNGGELWSNGTQYISWKYAGNPGSTVKIDLLNKGQFVQTIAASVPIGVSGKGLYAWQIPASLAFSQFYTVRVTSNDKPAITDVSDDRVWIGEGVDVNRPKNGDVLFLSNNAYLIVGYTWSVFGKIQVDLYKGGQFLSSLGDNPVSGYFDSGGWQWDFVAPMPQNLSPGTDYSIKITPLDAPSRAVMGGNFTISKTGITLASPNGGEIWQLGSTYTITWNWIGQPVSPGVDVQIYLNSQNGAYPGTFVVTPTTPIGANGSGSFTWTVPNKVPQSNSYTISVSSFTASNNNFIGTSAGPFAIGNFHKLSVSSNGQGYVQSSDFSINCGTTCSGLYAQGASVSLTAQPAVGYQFSGWSGGTCSGTGTCTVLMNTDVNIVANFVGVSPDFAMSVAPNSVTVLRGQTAQYLINISPQGGIAGSLSLSCSGLPAESSCSFQPNNLALGQSGTSSNLVISTTAAQSASLEQGKTARLHLFASWISWITFFCGLCFVPRRVRCGRSRLSIWFFIIVLCLLSGCGGGGTSNPSPPNPGTPAGTYMITINGQAGSTNHSTHVTLVVQ